MESKCTWCKTFLITFKYVFHHRIKSMKVGCTTCGPELNNISLIASFRTSLCKKGPLIRTQCRDISLLLPCQEMEQNNANMKDVLLHLYSRKMLDRIRKPQSLVPSETMATVWKKHVKKQGTYGSPMGFAPPPTQKDMLLN